jgi:predicted nucleotidyltransferase
MTEPRFVVELERKLGIEWAHLKSARDLTGKKRDELERALAESPSIYSHDLSVVVFGSLARDELTPGSDPDWTLLIDAGADPTHLETTQRAKQIIKRLFEKDTGREQTFGGMAFSHELVHQIGGQDDTNRNTTRRILLLLESAAIGQPDAYDRVVRNVLRRYLGEDRNFASKTSQYHIPRFLLNDFARYWRTMAVDFAYKAKARTGEGTAIRNIKLRMSRKMIYVSGLLTCFACQLKLISPLGSTACPQPGGNDEMLLCVDCLREFVRNPPLEILAFAILKLGADALSPAKKILTAYDEFIGILADDQKRETLEKLTVDKMESSTLFDESRKISHRFRDGLIELFFDNKELAPLTRTYGVF